MQQCYNMCQIESTTTRTDNVHVDLLEPGAVQTHLPTNSLIVSLFATCSERA